MLPNQDNQQPKKKVEEKWLAMDVRDTGTRPRPAKASKTAFKGVDSCSVCFGVCCSTSRELIAELFGMGRIVVSPKVSQDIRGLSY